MSVDSWVIKVVMASPQAILPPEPARPAGKYVQDDVDALLRDLRDNVPLSDRKLLHARLVGSNIEAWFSADSAGREACYELAELCTMAMPLRRPESFTCAKIDKITTKVAYHN